MGLNANTAITGARKLLALMAKKKRAGDESYANTIRGKLWDYQLPLWDYLEGGRKKRAIAVWHRRAGKDVVAWYWTIYSAMKKPGMYWYVLPTYPMAMSIIWEGRFITGERYTDIIPSDWIHSRNQARMTITLINGSQIILKTGEDCERSLRGSNPCGVVLSEYSFMAESLYETIAPIFSPKDHDGWMLFIFTPFGKNHAYDLYEKSGDDWFKQLLTVNDTSKPDGTSIITPEFIETERERGEKKEVIEREYYCSFEAGIYGTYYADEMLVAQRENRIVPLAYDRSIGTPVYTFWDLGIHDPTVIWFIQKRGDYFYFIDYYENHGKDTEFYIRILEEKKREFGYIYGMHVLPHDSTRKDVTVVGRTRFGLLEKGVEDADLGQFTIAPNVPINDGINVVKKEFKKFYFCELKCKKGTDSLKIYRQHKGKFGYDDRPEHDWASHASDAVRIGMVWAIYNNEFTPRRYNFSRSINYIKKEIYG